MKYGVIDCIQAERFANEGHHLWACAYEIDNEILYPRLRQTPVEGVLTSDLQFAVFTKSGTLRKSGRVSYYSRQYADTYEEAVELYNELVTKRKEKLEQLADTVYDDYIPAPFIPKHGGWHPIHEPPYEEVDVQVTYLGYYDKKPHCNAFAYIRNGVWYWTTSGEEINVDLVAWRSNCEPYIEMGKE